LDFCDYGCNTQEKLYNTWPYIYNTHGHGHGHLSQKIFFEMKRKKSMTYALEDDLYLFSKLLNEFLTIRVDISLYLIEKKQ
jgi:hypothetical protein